MSLLVYIPEAAETNPLESLRAVGLYELHEEGLTLVGAPVLDNGPDGNYGALFGWPGPREAFSLNLETQEWHKLTPHGELAGGRAWIGWEKGKRPTPETLARKKQLGGELLRLEDGNKWLIPVARQLPMQLGLTDSGDVSPTVSPKYQQFWSDSYGMLARFTVPTDGDVTIPWADGFDYCVSALAVNYRVTRDLVSILKLLDSESFWSIPKAVCEYEKLAQILQKKSP